MNILLNYSLDFSPELQIALCNVGWDDFCKWDTIKLKVRIGTESNNTNLFGINFCFFMLQFYFGMKIAITLNPPLESKPKIDYFVFKNFIIEDYIWSR